MPNWVHAGFNVTGDRAELQRFRDRMLRPWWEVGLIARRSPGAAAEAKASGAPRIELRQYTLDFNGIIPSPPEHERLDWEGWADEHWGTKWNAQDVDVRVDPDNIWFQFSTAWDFPEPVFMALAEEFPKLVFSGSAYFDNEDLELVGEFNGDDSWGPGKIEWIDVGGDTDEDEDGSEPPL